MVLVGVTGGMGAGKTTVLEAMSALGAETVDADDLVHALYKPGGAVYRYATRRWGRAVCLEDGRIDRAAIAELVFSSAAELDRLTELIHPLVKQTVLKKVRNASGELLCCGVPLLYEAAWENEFDVVIAVWCDAETQRQRLRQRGWSGADRQRRAARQLSMDEKLERSDFGIINCGSRRLLATQCRILYERIHPACPLTHFGKAQKGTQGHGQAF